MRTWMLMTVFLISSILLFACSRDSNSENNGRDTTSTGTNTMSDVDFWLTKGDQSVLLQKQNTALVFGTTTNSNPFIDVDSTQTFQTIDGFGFTLTGGSAYVINKMDANSKAALLNELFGNGSSGIGISYLRLSIGSSDLNSSVFSYDDMPSGQTDTGLMHFTLGPDTTDLIPILQQIVAINPSIKIIAAPWSAPAWMKDNHSTAGGSLLTTYYGLYAKYFVKYIQQMKLNGITIDAVTPQNEPLNPNNNPSLVMQAADEGSFIKNSLGPAFQASALTTKIVVYDHNCDRPDYPETILQDAAANPFVNGSAFHLYAGDISAMSQVHNMFPDKQLYFTEQYTGSTSQFSDDLKWSVKNVIIGSMRNWSRNALEWNLANDPSFGPHTPGGCTTCKGALTISGSSITRNVGYYIVAHASKFVPAGSVRISSTVTNVVTTAAFLTPDHKKVLIVENDDQAPDVINIRFNGKWVTTTVPAGAVCTYIW
ncbi:MAG TPA: glycoside hydrolase family 30 beta sandwich domain-containing protein [Puia sp.]|nr:glycoside hydrolase family 30 beta sandwich domain-containing protein [Puia sp.]